MSDGARGVTGVIWLVVICACCLVAACGLTPVAAQSANDSTQSANDSIESIQLSGSAAVSTEANATYLWRNEPLNLTVTVANDRPNATRNYQVCPYRVGDGEQPLVGANECPNPSLDPESNRSISLSGIEWPTSDNATGQQQLRVALRLQSTGENDGRLLDQRTVSVTVITASGDLDDDGLENSEDVVIGGLDDPDSDDDGLEDGPEVNEYGTNPNDPDSDGDGLEDGPEVDRYDTDPNDPDSDDDGLSDGFEANTLGTNPSSGATPVWLALAGLVVLGFAVLAVGLVRRRRGRRDTTTEGIAATERGSGEMGGEGTNGTERAADETPTSHEAAAGNGPAPSGDVHGPRVPGTEPGDAGVGTGPGDATPEPLTDEDRVLGLLRERGGRAKQATIVAETEWSKAKVSRLLSSMEEAGRIEKLSIGRENIISLAGHGPEAAQSPHEE